MMNYNLHTDDDWKGKSGNENGNNKDNSGSGNSGNTSGETGSSSGSDTTTNTSIGTANDNDGTAAGNTNNTDGSQNQSRILFPIDGEVSEFESELIGMIRITGGEKNYELIEYVNDVNREHTVGVVGAGVVVAFADVTGIGHDAGKFFESIQDASKGTGKYKDYIKNGAYNEMRNKIGEKGCKSVY